MAKKSGNKKGEIEVYKHDDTRKNAVPVGLASYDTSKLKPKKYENDPHLAFLTSTRSLPSIKQQLFKIASFFRINGRSVNKWSYCVMYPSNKKSWDTLKSSLNKFATIIRYSQLSDLHNNARFSSVAVPNAQSQFLRNAGYNFLRFAMDRLLTFLE